MDTRVMYTFWIYCSLLVAGCSKVPEEKKMNFRNPTTYIFNRSKSELRGAIIFSADSFKRKSMVLVYKEGKRKPLDSLSIFDQQGNEDDFYLERRILASPRKSYVYSIDGKKLDYVVSFHLHLKTIDNERTEVSVITVHPRVVLGEDFIPSPPHFVRQLKYYDVPPSTIEEYEILQTIGRVIGAKDMPSIKYPE